MDEDDFDAVTSACAFGYRGVWGPKITKIGALYRPNSIPVLDGHVALAFGFGPNCFSVKAKQRGMDRRARIDATVRALADWLRDHPDELRQLRLAVEPHVPEVKELSDLRLIDIVIWTSQDDRTARRGKVRRRWLTAQPGWHIAVETFDPVAISACAQPGGS